MVGLDIDLSGLTSELEKLGAKTQPAVAGGAARAGAVIFQEDVRQVNRIYGRPVPTRGQVAEYEVTQKSVAKDRVGAADSGYKGNGNLPAWNRDGSLLQNEQIRTESSGDEHRITIDSADEEKAKGRHALGTPARMPANPAIGVIRKNTWREDTVKLAESQIIEAFEDGVRKGLGI